MLKKAIIGAAMVAAISTSACGQSIPQGAKIISVQDIEKTIIQQVPYQVTVCRDVKVNNGGVMSGTTNALKGNGDALLGAIIGGIIGNKVGDGNDVAKVLGVVIGSNIGSKEQGEVRNVCSNVTRYNEVQKTSYSHSVLTFEYNGTIQSINFTK